MADYHKVGLLVLRNGMILLCRKRGLAALILPGGSLEAGESPEQCLQREIREELGHVRVHCLEHLGSYEDQAASPDPTARKTVHISLYRGELEGEPVASSEIEEIVWFSADSDRRTLSPILLRQILPDLLRRGILPWNG